MAIELNWDDVKKGVGIVSKATAVGGDMGMAPAPVDTFTKINNFIGNANELLKNALALWNTVTGNPIPVPNSLPSGLIGQRNIASPPNIASNQEATSSKKKQPANNPLNNPEKLFSQIKSSLLALKTLYGDVKISTLIQKMEENKNKLLELISKFMSGRNVGLAK